MADNMTTEQRSWTMSRIRKTDTKPELALRRLLFAKGMRYRKHFGGLPGRPDIVFPGAKLVIFVDGDFWHGWRFEEWEMKLSSPYWKEKIRRNRERDEQHRERLEADGWTVLRIWEHEIEADSAGCVGRIEKVLENCASWRERRRLLNVRAE